MTGRFLTEPEVADILRCSTSKVKRLRLAGRLPYLQGRPVLIAEADLNAFIATRMRSTEQAPPKCEPNHAEQAADARKWALQAVLLRRQGGKRSPKS
ncbi:helix-turn-helix domain-containing protein [Rhizobium leguminosarum]|uniref:helix-turn-helix domain-containing protein n=1 Tax=Rhizobium leguminosarum TaxID=384 RepID=UPI001C926F2C|nr:helix-turn-helix domain-containing protein [Rhizobium leguminosarum]MBY2969514.1 helix-turn-helix domain-containing protein [Rhizobium leguminosarum]MBY2976887.1 helix-turn-helix domain-containing protein [Rhizobium leguminosarum]MBY3005438.1 helix-turn-helix domain-containing protein [Rhizobium leguminosarum]